MAVSLTMSLIFVLAHLPTNTNHFPKSMWCATPHWDSDWRNSWFGVQLPFSPSGDDSAMTRQG
eukprot:11290773-Ditylum_brightwellii.AAC.1